MTLIPVDSSRCEGNDMNKHARLPRLGANDNKNSNYNRNNINSKEITRIMMLMLLRRMINTPTQERQFAEACQNEHAGLEATRIRVNIVRLRPTATARCCKLTMQASAQHRGKIIAQDSVPSAWNGTTPLNSWV